jgi:hypothetical protein
MSSRVLLKQPDCEIIILKTRCVSSRRIGQARVDPNSSGGSEIVSGIFVPDILDISSRIPVIFHEAALVALQGLR